MFNMIDNTDTGVRAPAVAGTFYPADKAELVSMVDTMLRRARPAGTAPKAIIAPHAGYIYSGPIAASVYARVRQAREAIVRVILLGPAHRVPLSGLAASSARAFATPLGRVPLDRAAIERILALPQVGILDQAHEGEHSLEVHLPFLQRVLGQFSLVPLVVGQATPDDVAEVLEALWGGPETLVVISSDLSHYLDYATARRLDAATSRAIEALAPDDISDEGACGRMPIRGLLRLAAKIGLKAATIDLRNSGDTAGEKHQVVGYGAYVFEENAKAGLTEAGLTNRERETLHQAASGSLRHGLSRGRPPPVEIHGYPERLRTKRACFVTLKLGQDLRGCVGSVRPVRPLIEDAIYNAYAAGFDDSRFPPLEEDELGALIIGISILGPLEAMAPGSEAELVAALRPNEDGLVLEEGERRGVFLPQVWDTLPEAADFVRQLKVKAGLSADHWSDSIEAFRFAAKSFSAPAAPA